MLEGWEWTTDPLWEKTALQRLMDEPTPPTLASLAMWGGGLPHLLRTLCTLESDHPNVLAVQAEMRERFRDPFALLAELLRGDFKRAHEAQQRRIDELNAAGRLGP